MAVFGRPFFLQENLNLYIYTMRSVIITAGGMGKRMKSALPKQFLSICDKPLLMHTVEKFYHFDPSIQIIITLPDVWREYWEALIAENEFKIPHRVVSGGAERYHSIKNALEYCLGDVIAIHDGVRPLVSAETLTTCFDSVKLNDAVIPVLDLKSSLRKISNGLSEAVDRSSFVEVQTPQCFKKEVILDSYKGEYHTKITDDASLAEEAGYTITCVPGNEENIKVTSQTDLLFAELLLK